MIRGIYLTEEGTPFERFDINPESRTMTAWRSPAPGKDLSQAIEATFDEAWRVVSLTIRDASAGKGEAHYHWDGDCWVGQVSIAGARREVSFPMASGLNIFLALTSFEGPFIRRIGLPPMSQRRVETLEIGLDDLEPFQSHCILERLADETSPPGEAAPAAACYRWTDCLGHQDFVWIREDHVSLGRSLARDAVPRVRMK